MPKPKIIKHEGRVSNINEKEIIVDIVRSSACASCHAKSACTAMDSQMQQISCANTGYNVKVGDEVTIILKQSTGVKAVMLAFVIPLCLLFLAMFLTITFFDKNEGLAAIVGIGTLAVYYVILHFFDKSFARTMQFKIEQ